MRFRVRVPVAALAAVASAVTIGIVGVGIPSASASVSVPWEPDSFSVGSITLYNSAGTVVTGGNVTDSPMFTYAVASATTTDTGVAAKARVSLATPDGTTHTYNYAGEALNAYHTYPVTSGPSVITSIGATTPVSTLASGDTNLSAYIAAFNNTQSGSYAGLYQLRLSTPSLNAMTPSAKYFSVDIQVTGSTWSVVYPVVVTNDTTSTTITAPSASTGATSTAVTLTAHVADTTSGHSATIPTGSVNFADGATSLGSAAVNSSGDSSVTIPANSLTIGSHSFTATYVPTGNFDASSTASGTAYSVTLPAPSNVIAPTSSAARVGTASSCNPGTWYYAGAFSYAWYLDASSSAFSTSAATGLIPAGWAGHRIRCKVTAINPGNSVAAFSGQVVVALGAAAVPTVRPRILGVPRAGAIISAYRGVWTNSPVTPTVTAYQYVWKIGTAIVSRAAAIRVPASWHARVVVLYVYAVRGGFATGVTYSLPVRIA